MAEKIFCQYLKNQYRIEYGQLRPCCWFKNSVDIFDVEAVKQASKYAESINDWNDANNNCDYCRHRELTGLPSPRLESFNRWNITDNTKVSIEIQIDRDCNGACLICGPWNSTTWEKYENKINGIPVQNISNHSENTNSFIKRISEYIDFSRAQEIRFLGGEPLKTNTHLDLLALVKNPQDTVISYTTNGSYKPDEETLSVWKNFKKIKLIFSIDGIDEHFNYLRWPLQWHQVENNLKFLINKPIPNIIIPRFSYTVTPFSIFYHDRYNEWAKQLFENQMFTHPFQPRGGPLVLSAIPPKLQSLIKEKYEKSNISKLLQPFNSHNYQTFMQYINTHDRHRNTDWKKVFPEISTYFDVTEL